MARDLIKTDINNMPYGELKAIITKILTGLEKSIKDNREALTTEIKKLKKNSQKLKIQ